MISLFKRPKISQTVVVIAPDKLSGQIYFDQFKKIYPNTILAPAVIRPRVLSRIGRPPILNRDSHGIGQDIANTIQKYYQQGYRFFTVACNTATFYPYANFATKILHWRHIPIHQINFKNHHKITDYRFPPETAYFLTNVSSIKIKYQKDIPLFLGTFPLSHRLHFLKYHTLFQYSQKTTALLVQEIIWRIKAIAGDNITTAPDYDDIANPELLDTKIVKLAEELKKLNIKQIIMGCTELPYAFNRLKLLMPDYQPELVDTACLVSSIYKNLVPKISK